MSDITIVYLVIVAAVALFVSNRVPVDLVAIGVGLSLYFTDILTVEETFAGFGSPTIILIASLFVVSEALDATGVTAWAGQQLMRRSGGGRARVLVLMMLLVAVLSALITPNGSVAALLPVVVVLAVRLGRSPSEMLIPLAFAAHAGALLVLTGSPVNVLVAEASDDAGGGGFGYFEFAAVGLPLLLGTIAIIVLLGPKLLPARKPRSMPPDFSQHARALLAQYAGAQPVHRLRVRAESPFVGRSREGLDLAEYGGVQLVSAQEEGGSGPLDRVALAPGDLIIVRGDVEAVDRLCRERHLELVSTARVQRPDSEVFTRDTGLVEVVIPPRSEAIGEEVFPGMVTDSGDLVILAVQRSGEDRPGKTTLAAGDTLLLEGQWEALDQSLEDPNVLVVDAPELVRRQLVPLAPRAKVSLGILATMVITLATGVLPPAVAAVMAAGGVILLRVLSVQQAYRAISWSTVILVGGMIPLTTAMTQTGAADQLADRITEAVGDGSPYVLLVALVLLVMVLGQLISNTATALIVIPVAIASAYELDVSIQPVLMAVNVAAAASFLTPVATPANLMVMEPGGYRFGDYWKLGLALMVLYFVVAVFLVPAIWRF